MNKQSLMLSTVLLTALLAGCASSAPREVAVDRLTPEEVAQITPAATPTLSLDEIVSLTQQKVSSDDIIAKIKTSNSQYDLTASQIVDLSK
ncbi:MAG TPA: hypothetical protein PLC01_02995, partial [Methylotenera sp.]|nr:hypothetical protein [Methylotenera sp.]